MACTIVWAKVIKKGKTEEQRRVQPPGKQLPSLKERSSKQQMS
jgi:hypothetical protein